MFHKTSARLAGLYLLIIMGISLFFSVNIYQLSVQEFARGLQNQRAIIDRDGDVRLPTPLRQLLASEQDRRYQESKDRVLARLVAINIVILVGGGFISYYLARRTLKPIEESHTALERFTADASHELRTPLAAMRSEIEVALMDSKLSMAEAKKLLNSNLEELSKLTSLSEGLLRLARLDNQSIPMVAISIKQVVDRALMQVLPSAEKKHILVNDSKVKDVTVLGDELSLAEVVIILLDNAIKYSPDKSEITLKALAEHGQVSLSVQDHGLGLSSEQKMHVFDRFYRADTARSKNKADGHGLGLAIAKTIIERHGGTITVESEPDKGSVFTVRFPQKS